MLWVHCRYCLPADMPELCRDFDKKKTYIYKPDGGCQGDGIFLLKDPSDLAKRTRSNAVVQGMPLVWFVALPSLACGVT